MVKRFGGFRALDVLSFAVSTGEILGLVGPNGSGKTTCINVISGLYRPDGGTIRFAGRSIGGLPRTESCMPASTARSRSRDRSST
jgi:branched-chain amino acid transport system ATP-binding protein